MLRSTVSPRAALISPSSSSKRSTPTDGRSTVAISSWARARWIWREPSAAIRSRSWPWPRKLPVRSPWRQFPEYRNDRGASREARVRRASRPSTLTGSSPGKRTVMDASRSSTSIERLAGTLGAALDAEDSSSGSSTGSRTSEAFRPSISVLPRSRSPVITPHRESSVRNELSFTLDVAFASAQARPPADWPSNQASESESISSDPPVVDFTTPSISRTPRPVERAVGATSATRSRAPATRVSRTSTLRARRGADRDVDCRAGGWRLAEASSSIVVPRSLGRTSGPRARRQVGL